MPTRLVSQENESDVILNKIEFLEDSLPHVFRLSGPSAQYIDIEYIPVASSKWDKNRFQLLLFENKYLEAENDVFEVYESQLRGERLGWIFPLRLLESNDNDFADHKNLNDYKFIAYEKLLERNIVFSPNANRDSPYQLSELVPECVVCLISKDATSKIAGFKVDDYILSFYEYGYLCFENESRAKRVYDRSDFVETMRNERRRVTLNKSASDILANDFTRSLFKEHLLQSDSELVRFILLYQIIEQLMEAEFEKKFTDALSAYKHNGLAKNDLKEAIIDAARERTLIRRILDPKFIDSGIKQEFLDATSYLFSELKLEAKPELADRVYDLRNLITHRLRHVTIQSISLYPITGLFERLITNFLINSSALELCSQVFEIDSGTEKKIDVSL